MNLPWDDQIIEKELIDYRWEIVTVHFEEATGIQYRAVKIDDKGVIKAEQLFHTKEKAQAFIDKQ